MASEGKLTDEMDERERMDAGVVWPFSRGVLMRRRARVRGSRRCRDGGSGYGRRDGSSLEEDEKQRIIDRSAMSSMIKGCTPGVDSIFDNGRAGCLLKRTGRTGRVYGPVSAQRLM